MMGSSLRLCFFSALAGCWSSYLLCPTFSEWVVRRDAAWYSQAFPGPFTQDSQTNLRERERLWTVTEFLGPQVRVAMHSALWLVRRHLRVAWGWTPFFLAFFAVSVLAGLFARERLYLGTTYASPAASYVAKRLVGVTVLAFILWCLGPVSAPYWGFYPLGLAAMTGLVAYVANLPLRL
jgi:hypothetical protein